MRCNWKSCQLHQCSLCCSCKDDLSQGGHNVPCIDEFSCYMGVAVDSRMRATREQIYLSFV